MSKALWLSTIVRYRKKAEGAIGHLTLDIHWTLVTFRCLSIEQGQGLRVSGGKYGTAQITVALGENFCV